MTNLPTENNNPGDLREAGQANSSTGAGGFAAFPNPQDGYGALLNQLQTDITKNPNWTLADFANSYAPPSDNNDSAQYAANLANQLGVPPNATISTLQPKIGKFAQAVAHNEGYDGSSGSNVSPSTPQAQTQSTSDTPGLDAALGIAGGVGALGLTGLAIAQLGADPVSDVAAAGADAAVAPEAESFLSGLWNKFTGAAGRVAEGAIGGEVVNSVLGGNSSQSGYSTMNSDAQSTPTPQLPPSNESVTPESGLPTPESPASVPSAPTQLEQQIPEATQNSQRVLSGLDQTLKQTSKGSVIASEQEGQEGMGAMSRYSGLVGESDENGRYDATGTEENANKLLEEMDNGEQHVFDAEGKTANLNEGIQSAQEGNKQYVSAPDRPEADKYAQDILKAYAGDYGDKDGNISLGNWHRIYKQEGKTFERNGSNARNAAHKSVAMAAKKMIEKNTYHKDFYKKMQKEKKAIIHSKEINKYLHGKKIANSKSFTRDLLKKGGGALGIYLGDKIGGPLGAILGNMVGEHISRAADKKHGRNVFETKGMKAAMAELEKKSPAVHAVLQREIKKASQEKFSRDMKREAIPKLPAPKGIPLGARKGEDKSIVVGGKRPPASFAQAEARKAGRPEYGGRHNFQKQQEVLRKMVKPTRK